MTNNSSSETLQGDGLAGRNGGQAASSNKMNLLINKLIKALNVYMEAPKEKTVANASANNNKVINNASAPKMPNVGANNLVNNITSNNAKKNIKNNVINDAKNINKSNNINNTKKNTKNNSTNNTKNSTIKNNTANKSTIKNNKSMNIKGGRRTRYNKMRSNLKTRRQK